MMSTNNNMGYVSTAAKPVIAALTFPEKPPSSEIQLTDDPDIRLPLT
ncbi:hypothetical protein QTP86_034698 [Hemibagrus guttatus]|nr:hypothetical protein QTP86_034698 [Hemibagrus guttatus]